MDKLEKLDKIRIIKLKEKGYYKILVGNKELADSAVGVTATLDPSTSLTTVNIQLITKDFEWYEEK